MHRKKKPELNRDKGKIRYKNRYLNQTTTTTQTFSPIFNNQNTHTTTTTTTTMRILNPHPPKSHKRVILFPLLFYVLIHILFRFAGKRTRSKPKSNVEGQQQ